MRKAQVSPQSGGNACYNVNFVWFVCNSVSKLLKIFVTLDYNNICCNNCRVEVHHVKKKRAWIYIAKDVHSVLVTFFSLTAGINLFRVKY